MVKIKGKYLTSLGPAFSLTTPSITEYVASSAACQLFFGTRKALVKVARKMKAVNAVMNRSHSEELFNEKIRYEKSFVLKLNKNSKQQTHIKLLKLRAASAAKKYTLYNWSITDPGSSIDEPDVAAVSNCADKTEGPEQRDSR